MFCVQVYEGQNLLIMGPSGGGKTSVLRTLAGLWQSGKGTIYSYGLRGIGDPGVGTENGSSSVLFLPQRPYMVLGSLRDQLLYPTWTQQPQAAADGDGGDGTGSSNRPHKRPVSHMAPAASSSVSRSAAPGHQQYGSIACVVHHFFCLYSFADLLTGANRSAVGGSAGASAAVIADTKVQSSLGCTGRSSKFAPCQ